MVGQSGMCVPLLMIAADCPLGAHSPAPAPACFVPHWVAAWEGDRDRKGQISDVAGGALSLLLLSWTHLSFGDRTCDPRCSCVLTWTIVM